MTLNTWVHFYEPIDVMDIFMELRELIGAPEDLPFIETPGLIHNPVAAGLPAMIRIEHNYGDPLQEDEDNFWEAPVYAKLSLDTTYGYAPGAANLHAWLLQRLRWYCDAKWRWQNEWTGEWFSHDDDCFIELGDVELGALQPSGSRTKERTQHVICKDCAADWKVDLSTPCPECGSTRTARIYE